MEPGFVVNGVWHPLADLPTIFDALVAQAANPAITPSSRPRQPMDRGVFSGAACESALAPLARVAAEKLGGGQTSDKVLTELVVPLYQNSPAGPSEWLVRTGSGRWRRQTASIFPHVPVAGTTPPTPPAREHSFVTEFNPAFDHDISLRFKVNQLDTQSPQAEHLGTVANEITAAIERGGPDLVWSQTRPAPSAAATPSSYVVRFGRELVPLEEFGERWRAELIGRNGGYDPGNPIDPAVLGRHLRPRSPGNPDTPESYVARQEVLLRAVGDTTAQRYGGRPTRGPFDEGGGEYLFGVETTDQPGVAAGQVVVTMRVPGSRSDPTQTAKAAAFQLTGEWSVRPQTIKDARRLEGTWPPLINPEYQGRVAWALAQDGSVRVGEIRPPGQGGVGTGAPKRRQFDPAVDSREPAHRVHT